MTLEQIKATVRSYKGDYELFYYDNDELVAWSANEGHNNASIGYYKKTKLVNKAQARMMVSGYNQRYNANLIYSSRLNHQ